MMTWTPEKVSRFWDYQSRFPGNYFTNQVGKDLIATVRKFLPRGGRAGVRVLDYGCGMGFLIRHLLDQGYNVAGLDFSADSVAGVKAKFGGEPGFLGADLVEAYAGRGEKFDVIFVIEVIEHLDDEYLAVTMRNVKVLLSERGVAVFSTPNEEKLEDSHVFCAQCDHVFHTMQHVRSWSATTLSDYLRAHGLNPRHVFTTRLSPSRTDAVYQAVKGGLQRLLGRGGRKPNLVAVCTRI